MKRLFPIIVCVIFGCQGDIVEQNPYLNNLPSFEFELNLDLPLYDNLRFAGQQSEGYRIVVNRD